MVFPVTPRNTVVELFVNSKWTDITATGDVYARDGVHISRGRRPEGTRPDPASCTMTINNRGGNYSPRNPNGAYYGSLGRNTPLRVGIELATDTFTRSVSGGWASADTGQAWSVSGTGGTVQASDFNVTGSVGTLSVPVANGTRQVDIPVSLRDVDVTVAVTMNISSVTGASVTPVAIQLRKTSSSDYYMGLVTVAVGGAVSVSVTYADGTVIVPSTATGVTYSAGMSLSVRFQAEAFDFRIKAWNTTIGEPYLWTIVGSWQYFPLVPGTVALLSSVATGNTNTKPIVFSFDNLHIRSPRFYGEVSSWPPRWDNSQNDVYVPIEVYGVTRRLGQGQAALPSTLRNTLSEYSPTPVAYWPCEDGKDSAFFTSQVGGNPLLVFQPTDNISGTSNGTQFSNSSTLPASAPLPTVGSGSRWYGIVPAYTATNFLHLSFVVIPSSTLIPNNSFATLIKMNTSGSASRWEINPFGTLTVGGDSNGIYLDAYSAGAANLLGGSSGPGGKPVVGPVPLDSSQPLLVDVLLQQSGSDIVVETTYARAVDVTQIPTAMWISGTRTITAQSLGKATSIEVNPGLSTLLDGWTLGHIALRTDNTFLDSNYIASYATETAGDRVVRVCTNSAAITPYVLGFTSETMPMGPQGVDTLTNVLDECADTDLGTLYEPKGATGLVYRTRTSMYSQNYALTLDYAQKQVSPPLEPVDDDAHTANDVTVNRKDGSWTEAILTTGRMSILDPSVGGAGLYAQPVTVNCATDTLLPQIAGFLLNAGTTDETRYPSITVKLHSPYLPTALQYAALDVSIDDWVAVNNATVVTPDQIIQLARGYDESIYPFEHEITFNCAPALPYQVPLADGGFYLNSGTSTLTSGPYSPTATSLSVATTDTRDLWATGATSLPVTLAGELVLVTNITGASSPQTFTVTRSLNGITKTQTTGTTVTVQRLYQTVLGL